MRVKIVNPNNAYGETSKPENNLTNEKITKAVPKERSRIFDLLKILNHS